MSDLNRENEPRTYNRPNRDWVCTAESGCGCPGGPTPQGRCAATSPCRPVLEEDRWLCNRPTHRGGTCETGPDPTGRCCHENTGCVPQRSLRSKRKIFVVCTVALITGVLLLGIWKPNRNEFLAPGGLSSHHAQIWSGPNAEDRCIACHSAGALDPIGWFASVLGGGSHMHQPQYQKCLSCHENVIAPDKALLVHNLPAEKLAEIKARIQSSNPQESNSLTKLPTNSIFASPVKHSGQVTCATCHREHHGNDHDLAAMTDQQCQSCHSGQFHSFESDHPEFRSYALSTDPGIHFDHYVHQVKYFSEAKRSFDCQSCHQSDADGNVMRTTNFDSACAECHVPSIEASLTQGLPVFRLPSLDVEWLKKQGLDIGQWPDTASGSFDGTLPPAMKVLLAGDPRAVQAMKTLGPEFDLFDVDIKNQDQLLAVSQLAIAIKALLLDLSRQGQSGLKTRLEKIAGNKTSTLQLKSMFSGLSAETFSAAQEKWFPNLQTEEQRLLSPEPLFRKQDVAAPALDNRVTPASFFQEDAVESSSQDDDSLIQNPIAKFYNESNPGQNSTTQDSTAQDSPSDNSSRVESPPLDFVDLPQKVTQRPPIGKFSDRFPEESDSEKIRVNPHTQQQQPDRQSSQFKAEEPNAVGNRFYYPRSQAGGQVKPLPQDRSQQPNQQEKPPIVIRDGNLPQNNSDEVLMENPIARLMKPGGQAPGSSDARPADPTQQALEPQGSDLQPTPDGVRPRAVDPSNPQLPLDRTQSTQPERIVKNQTGPKPNVKDSAVTQTPGSELSQRANRLPDLNRLPPIQRVPLGGWYRDDQTLTIAYRQSGHGDELTRNWYDFVMAIREPELRNSVADFKKLIASPTSPGQCGSCHQQTRNNDGSMTIRWKSQFRDPSIRGFTRFSHRPHLVQPGDNNCTSCHELDPAASILNRATEPNSNGDCRSGFHPIRKSNCVNCHNGKSKTQGCTQCHNYHVGDVIGFGK